MVDPLVKDDLFNAVHSNDMAKFREIIENSDVNLEISDEKGNTPLHIALIKKYQDFSWLLIQNNANIEARNHDGKVPLHYAASSGMLDIVKYLINQKVELKIGIQLA